MGDSNTGKYIVLFLIVLLFSPVFLFLCIVLPMFLGSAIYDRYGEGEYVNHEIAYVHVDPEFLKEWLVKRNSALATDRFIEAVLVSAKKHNVNPLLLVAITGQEQGFVPLTDKDYDRIAKNPWNLYGCWCKTDFEIEKAADIVGRTIVNLSKGCPPEEDVLKWINRKYADHKGWYVGVSKFLKQLTNDHNKYLASKYPNGIFIPPGERIWPIRESGWWVNSPYGYRIHPIWKDCRLHVGVDIISPNINGKPVYASYDGTIVSVNFQKGWGNFVVLRGDDGIVYEYAHLSRYGKYRAGSRVETGDIIGYVGSTGDSTGAHLHFNVRQNGRYVDPEVFFGITNKSRGRTTPCR